MEGDRMPAKGLSREEAAEKYSVAEGTIQNWAKKPTKKLPRPCPWLKRGYVRTWQAKRSTNQGVQTFREYSLADLEEIDKARRGEKANDNGARSQQKLTASEAEDDPEIGIPARTIRRWAERGCPAYTKIPKPPKRWKGPVPGKKHLKPAGRSHRQAGMKMKASREFWRKDLLAIKAAYENPKPDTPGYWPTLEEARPLYGITEDRIAHWEDGCLWLDGEKLRWRNGRRSIGGTLFGVIEYDPAQLAEIAKVDRASELRKFRLSNLHGSKPTSPPAVCNPAPAAKPKPAAPKTKGGRRKGSGKHQPVRDWLETEAAKSIINKGGKWVNHRLADAWNEKHPNDRRDGKTMKKIRSYNKTMKKIRSYKPTQ